MNDWSDTGKYWISLIVNFRIILGIKTKLIKYVELNVTNVHKSMKFSLYGIWNTSSLSVTKFLKSVFYFWNQYCIRLLWTQRERANTV
jgi:predicted KAP-like P-loop ATPase